MQANKLDGKTTLSGPRFRISYLGLDLDFQTASDTDAESPEANQNLNG